MASDNDLPIENRRDESSDPRVGESIAGRYTIVRLLGSGGMGRVYEAKHTTLARRFAVKFLQPRLAEDKDVLRRFENEAKAAGGLEHPNLVAVTDFGRTDDGSPYLVMEYLKGEDCANGAGLGTVAAGVGVLLVVTSPAIRSTAQPEIVPELRVGGDSVILAWRW